MLKRHCDLCDQVILIDPTEQINKHLVEKKKNLRVALMSADPSIGKFADICFYCLADIVRHMDDRPREG